MINLGILTHLNELIFNDNLQIQTRALAVVQYFDGKPLFLCLALITL
jgi:hypothetical protein